MDNDKQVTDLVQGTRDHFLNQPLQPDDRDKDSFDLEREFSKSAKNRSMLIPFAVAIFLALLGVGAWIASQFTEEASQKSTVSIGSFEDLKLKEIFDTARKNKKDLETVQAQMDELTRSSAAKIASLQQAGSSRADIASVNDPSGAQARNILAQTSKQVADEKSALAVALGPLKTQADDIQKKIDTYDDRIGQLNKKNQQVLDSQQRLFDLEKQKLTGEYEARLQAQTDDNVATVARLKRERDDLVAALKAKHAEEIRKLILKYNPVINDPVLNAQLAALGTKAAAYPALTLPARIANADLLDVSLQSSLATRVERTQGLLARMKQIPYENSVPPLLNAIDNAIADSLSGYDDYLVPLAKGLSDLDAVIDRQTAAIAEKDGQIADLSQQVSDLKAAQAAEAEERTATEAAEKAQSKATLARWTGAVDSFAATVKEDGVVADPKVADDLIVVLKADRAKALSAALDAAAKSTVPSTANVATIRDAGNNAELGTVSLELTDAGWRGKTIKLLDQRKPFKAFDRVVLFTAAKK